MIHRGRFWGGQGWFAINTTLAGAIGHVLATGGIYVSLGHFTLST